MPKARITFLLFIFIFSACATPTMPVQPTVSPVPSATEILPTLTDGPATRTPTLIPAAATKTVGPSSTPIPSSTQTETPAPGPSPTPTVPMAFAPSGEPLACRKGPDSRYKVLTDFTAAEIVGMDESGKWWYLMVEKGPGNYVYCWVLQKQVNTGGVLANVIVAEPELARVTDVSVDVLNVTPDPLLGYVKTVNCSNSTDGPVFHVVGLISADGPLDQVKYLWGGSAVKDIAPQETHITGWDEPQTIKLDLAFPASEGTYSLRLFVFLPNENLSMQKLVVKCK